MSSVVCPGCGARLAEGAERCDLCGSPVAGDVTPGAGDDIPEPGSSSRESASVFCNECGWKNPPGARYCSQCGTKLQEISAGVKPAGLKTPEVTRPAPTGTARDGGGDVTRHVAILIGISVLIVVALYMVTVVSKQRVEPARAEAAVEAPADVRSAAVIDEHESIPVADRHAPSVDSLRSVIASAEGDAAYETRRELADFFVEIGRVDLAAIEAQRLARDTDVVDDWRRAGNLLHDWMETVNNQRKTDVALLTIEAYENVLDEEPGDLDARAALGWAYQYDPQNPMQAIEQTSRVLEEDPDHLAANYNRAVFLLRINRVAEATEQFERVVELAEAGSPYERQAQAWIGTIQQQDEQR